MGQAIIIMRRIKTIVERLNMVNKLPNIYFIIDGYCGRVGKRTSIHNLVSKKIHHTSIMEDDL